MLGPPRSTRIHASLRAECCSAACKLYRAGASAATGADNFLSLQVHACPALLFSVHATSGWRPARSVTPAHPCPAAQDQLLKHKQAGSIFRFLHEAPITFAPTYKFDKGDPDRLAYDSSEKQRVPAWTDRILFRGSELTRGADTRPSMHSADGAPPQPQVPARAPRPAPHPLPDTPSSTTALPWRMCLHFRQRTRAQPGQLACTHLVAFVD